MVGWQAARGRRPTSTTPCFPLVKNTTLLWSASTRTHRVLASPLVLVYMSVCLSFCLFLIIFLCLSVSLSTNCWAASMYGVVRRSLQNAACACSPQCLESSWALILFCDALDKKAYEIQKGNFCGAIVFILIFSTFPVKYYDSGSFLFLFLFLFYAGEREQVRRNLMCRVLCWVVKICST